MGGGGEDTLSLLVQAGLQARRERLNGAYSFLDRHHLIFFRGPIFLLLDPQGDEGYHQRDAGDGRLPKDR